MLKRKIKMRMVVIQMLRYISKYMTKDIDDRLFSHRRYLYSRNLESIKESYIDLENKKELSYYKKIIQDKVIIYQNKYYDPYSDSIVTFLEFLKK